MAQPDLQQFKKRGLAIALRTAAGVPADPSAASNGVLLFNGSSGTEFDKIERPLDRPHFSGQPFAIGAKRAFIEGEFELYPPVAPGNVTTGDADCAVLLLPAGMAQVKDADAKTTRYHPISSDVAVADAKWWHAGTLKSVLAARNNVTGLTLAIGDRFKGNIRIQGDYTTVAEEDLPAISVPTTVPVVARHDNTRTTITTEGSAPLIVWGKSLAVDFGNTIAAKEYSSHKETGISDRLASWTLRIARTDLSDFNPWSVRDAAQTVEVAVRMTQPGNAYSELAIRGQIENVNEVDVDGDYGWELSGPCVASNAGGDEFHIEFGEAAP